MNAAQDQYRLPQMRASDADRDGVVAALSEHFQTGRLTSEELEERTGRALTACTLDELDQLTADLPAIRPAGRRWWSGREGWGTRCWHRLLPRLPRWPLPPWCSAWAMAAMDGIGGGSSRPVCSSRGGWPGGAVSTGTPGRTDRRANGKWAPEPRERQNGALPGNRARRVDGLTGTGGHLLASAGASVACPRSSPPPPCPPPDAQVSADLVGRLVGL